MLKTIQIGNNNNLNSLLLSILIVINIIAGAYFYGLSIDVKPSENIENTNNNTSQTQTVTTNSNDDYIGKYIKSAVIIKNKQGDILGSGIFVAPNVVLTGKHVIIDEATGENKEITIIHENRVITNSNIVERKYFNQDIAVLRIENYKATDYASVSSVTYSIGDDVGTVCNINGDNGLALSYIKGNISADNRQIVISGNGTYNNLIQMSMPVEKGCSGGAFFNKDGEIIGVIFAKTQNLQNIGFGIQMSDEAINFISNINVQ